MKKEHVVVIGNGMVGHKFVESLLNDAKGDEFTITVFCEEPRLAYDRVQLSSYFSGTSADELALTSESYYQDNKVNYHLNDKITEIHTDENYVVTASGEIESYDKLVLATGSYPFVPPIPGNDGDHCLVYRTIEDLEAITESASAGRVGVVVGGGLLGLEAANALKALGLETHVVEFAPRLMAVQLDEGGGNLLKSKIENLGVSVHTEKNTKEIVPGEKHRYRMNFADGESLETDLVLFSAGIRPQDELARSFGLEIGERGGIVVDDHCLTSVKNVYAIGECALWDGKIFGLVAPGYQMAKVAVSHICGGSESFTGADMSTKLKLLGVDVASIGDAHSRTPGARNYTFCDEVAEVYKRLVVSADNKKLLGAVMVGDAEAYGTLQQICVNELDLPDAPEQFILPASSGDSSSLLGVDSLPDTAHVCTCNAVTKGDLCSAVQNGCTDLASLKSETGASNTCGGCSSLVGQVLNSELAKLGVEVKNHLCEHFEYSRQELYDIVRIKKIRTFHDLLDECGSGHGCAVCKPAAASILASCWNDYILKNEHMGLQDTNDIYLGNMQKDGTYSIVPRVPGGEITPEKLIVLGEVAKKFNLYTKVTGGQRIDLFGAEVHELPAIWRILVDAGFETGHAYGKALRTVKSCVGSSWCRYGVQDSVGSAIEIEERYRGLRSPHKIKMAVSGCTRECAEAQSKDVGVIATEKGWNLYVCGNGGMRPRHADLFASDLDYETLIKYIDRFLMFYVRTADRLQRTSVWLENMEGGLDYLRSVIIDDKLEIGGELEAEMQDVIDTYQCEWKTTIEDEEKLKRFKHFVNDDGRDNHLAYVYERGQKRPATIEERKQLSDGDSDSKLPVVELVD